MEKTKLRNGNFEFRYQVTGFDEHGSLDSVWRNRKDEATEAANAILKQMPDVQYVEVYNMLNQKYNFTIKREHGKD